MRFISIASRIGSSVRRCAIVGVALMSLMPFSGQAADARSELAAFSKNVNSATGSFTQVTQSSRGGQQPVQQGSFAFERPGKFRWAISEPYEQLIVSDGKDLYQYDPDLAQVSIRPVGPALGNAPAQVLFGSGDLEKSFKLEPMVEKDGLQWLRATPLSPDAGFSQMEIGFDHGLPVRIDIRDAFDQTTHVEFTAIVPNPDVPDSDFRFEAPKGVDVVRME